MTRATIACAVALLAVGCTITETGNPAVGTQMSLTAYSSDPGKVSLGPGAGEIVVEQAWVAIGDVRFVRASACDAGGEAVDVPGPWIADLAAGSAIMQFDLAGDSYCRVRVPLQRARPPLPTGAPADLSDHSLVLAGHRMDAVPFRLVSSVEREADVRSSGAPFAIDAGHRALLLSFDVAAWFQGVELEGAEPGPDGTVLIDESDHRELLDRFDENVDHALRLFRDGNGDGHVDTQDTTEELADGDPST